MKRLLPVLFILVCSFSALGQLVYPSNRTISSLEKNMLFNALKRFTVTQEGTARLDTSQLFNGVFVPTYTNGAPSDSDPIVITIENINAPHVQSGTWIGWSTRLWGPTKFKIEVYNTYPSPAPHAPQNAWFTVADVSNYTQQDFIISIPYSAPGKVRFTFYRGSGTDGRLGISELFLLHPEGAFAYDNFLVKYDKNLNVVLGNSVNTPDSTRGDLAIYANAAPDNRASLKIGQDESKNLEIYRNRTAPDIYFKTNEANTGHMRFVTNNSNFTFNGGKVGIGINTPNAPLQFGNTEASRKIVLFETANNDHQFYGLGINPFMFRFQLTNTGGSYGFFAATSASASTELARITGTGRLGIGTSSPNSLLHISGNSGTAVLTLNRPVFASTGGIGAIGFAGGSNRYLTSITSYYGADSTQAYMSFKVGAPNTNLYGLTERMRIDKDGNVGIGTESAIGDRFTVYGRSVFKGVGTGAVLAHDNEGAGRTYLILDGDMSTNGAGGDYIMIAKTRNGPANITNYGSLLLQTNPGSASGANKDIRISANGYETVFKENGQVGIGTTAIPTGYKLAVGGDVIAEKIKVKKRVGGVWPDYVFSPDYKLPSLEEVELFTKKNSHLLEIPSAKEIENEGQDLGEMNRLLLKKVEELTLYLIEQNKNIIEQDKEIKALKIKVEHLEKR